MSSFLLLKPINRLLRNKVIHNLSLHSISYLLTKLNNRKLIVVKGIDSYHYIQGLVTNDLRHLESSTETSVDLDCIHSFLLNVSGRVITDLFIYKIINSEDKQLYIEMDSNLLDSITKFLKAYRVRRKVKINIEESVEVWALFPSELDGSQESVEEKANNKKICETFRNEELLVVKDPRLRDLGFRLLVKKCNNNEKETTDPIKSYLYSKNVEFSETEVDNYHKYRYQLGVGEGVKDFPVESCFPLECNADYLHGLSFHKGCYVGQELTARIYHTGVIRKRLMPIEIISENQVLEPLPIQNVQTDDGKNVGKFRSNLGIYGLSLLKFDDVIKANKLTLTESGLTIKTWKPFWWPKEVNRDSIPCGREDH